MSLKKQYRPWENYDQFSVQIRTYGAQEAVRRAQKIVERNSAFSQELEAQYAQNAQGHKLENRPNSILESIKLFFKSLRDSWS